MYHRPSKQKMVNKRTDILRLILLLLILVLLNVLGSFQYFRLDLTAEGRYTLSEPTKEVLDGLEDKVLFRVYLEGEFPSGFRRLSNEAKRMLREFRAYNDNIEFEFVDPSAGESEEERQQLYRQLTEKGIEGTQLQISEGDQRSSQIIFPGGVVYYLGREGVFTLLKSQAGASPEAQLNTSVQSLEFELANALRKLQANDRKGIGFVEGHGELSDLETEGIGRVLKESYDLARLDLRSFEVDSVSGQISIAKKQAQLNRFDLLVIAKPRETFADLDKYLLDQFVMQGGKIIWLIDAVFADMDSLSTKNQALSYPLDLGLNDILFRYGVRLNDHLVQDALCAEIPVVVNQVNGVPQYEFFPWLYFPLAMPYQDHPIVSNINPVRFEFPSSIDTIVTPGVQKTILLSSSRYTKTTQAPTNIRLSSLNEQPQPEEFTEQYLPLAILLEGTFTSNFKNRLQPRDGNGEELSLIEESEATAQIVIADGDVLKNQFQRGEALRLGYDKFTGNQYGNEDLILNAVDYLLDDSGLTAVRSRELQLRLLDATRIRGSMTYWKTLNTALPLVLVVLMGLLLNYWRRRKYAK